MAPPTPDASLPAQRHLGYATPMSQANPKPAARADIEALAPDVVGEIAYGVLHTHPRPAPRHARAASTLGVELGGPFVRGRGGPGGWVILDEPELHLGPHVVVSELAGWRRGYMPKRTATAFFEMPPDGIAAILSPSTARINRTVKLAITAADKVAHAWYVDPDQRTLEVFALTSDPSAGTAAAPGPQPKWLLAAPRGFSAWTGRPCAT
ncbi:MAG: Uma2 family endonuclease [Pseudomonadota bacterium]